MAILLIPVWWSTCGLALDFLGVLMLGIDLIRLQGALRGRAQDNLNHLSEMADEYGGVESWAEEIKRQSRWVSSHVYSDYHAQDEVSYNAERHSEKLADLSDCVAGLAANLARIMNLVSRQAENDEAASQKSLRISIAGIVLIALGFAMQIIGALLQPITYL